MKIEKRIIPVTNDNRPALWMAPDYITVHTTRNLSYGADAEMHARFVFNDPASGVSWHFTVDDGKIIYQHLPLDENGWHAGDGYNGTGNRRSIGIEICENADGDFSKAVKHAMWLVNHLMDMFNIPISRVKPHNHWSGKDCPKMLLDRWDWFIDGVVNFNEDEPVQVIDEPDRQVNSVETSVIGKRVESIWDDPSDPLVFRDHPSWSDKYVVGTLPEGYGFPCIVDLLEVDGGYMYKVKNSNGEIFYVTASEKFVRVEGADQPDPEPKGNMETNSIVVYLNSIGEDSSFGAREELAERYGIHNYRGTAQQNLALLAKLRGEPAPEPEQSNYLPDAVYYLKSPQFSGSGVKAVQNALANNNPPFYPEKGAPNDGVDGYYGPKTADAVKRFQSYYGLKQDGIYGPNTRAKLMSLM